MNAKKILTLAVAFACLATFAFALTADDSSAAAGDITKAKEADWGKYTDASPGHFYVYLANNTDAAITVKVVVYDGITGDEKDTTMAEIEANATEQEVRMTFSYGSSDDKLVRYTVYSEDGETVYFSDGSYEIEVKHSMWKNTSTYVIIVLVIIAIIVVAYFVMRARANKSKASGNTRTFTEMEAERKAKKAGKVAQKETYKGGDSKKKRK